MGTAESDVCDLTQNHKLSGYNHPSTTLVIVVQVQVFYVVLRGWPKPAHSPLPIWKTALELSTLSAITGSGGSTHHKSLRPCSRPPRLLHFVLLSLTTNTFRTRHFTTYSCSFLFSSSAALFLASYLTLASLLLSDAFTFSLTHFFIASSLKHFTLRG